MEINKLYELYLECGGRVSTDTRTLSGGEMFFALKGENFDGNAYALKAVEAGARYAVVNADSEAASSGNPAVIPVPDTLAALQDLARHHRRSLRPGGRRLPVLGLTGTNGKTTTKELIRSVLSCKYNVVATEGNLNNDIGVPMSLLKIRPDTEFAVIEMGASHPDDIEKLVRVCEPDYGLITNVGKAHLLGFGSFEGVKKAKGALYDWIASHGSFVFLNADDEDLSRMAVIKSLEAFEYGLDFWQCMVLPSDAEHPFLRMAVPSNIGGAGELSETLLAINTSLVGSYNATNVLAALAVGLRFGVSLEDAIVAVEAFKPVNKRSQMTRTERNILIVDAYNANPTSMAAALDNFANVASEAKVAMLGDMRELGEDSAAEHEAVLSRLDGIPEVFLVGDEFGKAVEKCGCPENVRWFATSASLAEWLAGNPMSGRTVLIKGSRGIEMEKVIPAL